MNRPSENTDRTMTAHPREAIRRSVIGFSLAIVALLIAVVDKLLVVMQAPSAVRIIMLVAYTAGLAAACFSLWQLTVNRPRKRLKTDGDTLDRKNQAVNRSGRQSVS